MNSNRVWVIGAVLVMAVILVATWFLGVSPQLSAAALSKSDRETVENQNAAAEITLADLKTQYEGIDALKDELAVARLAVPADKDQATLLKTIGTFASKNDVVVTSLNFLDPLPYVDGVSVDPALGDALTLVNSSNFLTIPIEMNVTGDYGDVMNFVQSIQTGDRAVLVHDLSMDGGEVDNSTPVVMAISADTYVLLDAENAIVVEAPAEETPETDAGVVAE